MLNTDGRVIIAAHNSVVETKVPDGFENWQDPFREALISELKLHKIWKRNLRRNKERARYKTQDITNAFKKCGFELAKLKREVLPFEMSERHQMWRIPAIMDSVADVMNVGVENISEIVDRVAEKTANMDTMPRTVTYWLFRLGPR